MSKDMTTPYRGSPTEAFRLQYRPDGSSTQSFTLTESQLVHEWASGTDRGRMEYPFEQLEAELGEVAGRGGRPPGALERAFFFGGLTAVVAFSTLKASVPLLPFFLGAVSFYDLQRHFSAVGTRIQYLVITRRGAEEPIYIDRRLCNPAQVDAFKEVFSQRVRSARSAVTS